MAGLFRPAQQISGPWPPPLIASSLLSSLSTLVNCPKCLSVEVVVSKAGNSGVYWLRQCFWLSMRCRACSDRFFAPGWLRMRLLYGLRSAVAPKRGRYELGPPLADRDSLFERCEATDRSAITAELQEATKQLEESRERLAEQTQALEHVEPTDFGELRRAVDEQRLELAESIRQLRVAQTEFEQCRNNLLSSSDQQGLNGAVDRTEFEQLCLQVEQTNQELVQVKNSCEETRLSLVELSHRLTEREARVEQITRLMEEDRAVLEQIKEIVQRGRPELDPDFRSWIASEIASAVRDSLKSRVNGHRRESHPRKSISFHCSNCTTHLVVAADYAGKTGLCKACNQKTVIPSRNEARPTTSSSPKIEANRRLDARKHR